MLAIIRKELSHFFSSFLGLGIMTAFYVLMGIYLWWLDGNILDYGFAEMQVFFDLSPWFFLFFIPAIAMNSFSEEIDRGTFQLICSLPLTTQQILGAKIGALAFISLCTLFPSVIFVLSIALLGLPTYNFDASLIWGGYLALFLLILCFVSIGLLSSSLSKKQPVAFILGVFLNFVFWQGTKEIGLDYIDLSTHYTRMSMGVLSLGDLLFFGGFILLCWGLIRIRISYLI